MAKKLPGNINLNEAMMKNVNIIVESIMEGIFPVIKQYIDQRFQQLEAQKINPISIKETVQSSAKRIFDAEGVGKEHYSNIGGGILKEKTVIFGTMFQIFLINMEIHPIHKSVIFYPKIFLIK